MIKTFLQTKGSISAALLALMVLVIQSTSLSAATFKANHPERYSVVEGDTLWDISEMFLKDPWKWPEIWHLNDQINNPHLIYPGDVIELIYIGNQPKLTLQRRDKNVRVLSDGTVKLSPKARITPIDSVIPAIPLDAVQPFLVENRVVEPEVIEDSPYIIAGGDERIVMGSGDKIYARGDWAGTADQAYGVYRPGISYRDPDTNEMLGVQAVDLGLANIVEVNEDIATLKLLRSTQEIRISDRLLATVERKVDSTFFPKAPSTDIEGKIIHVFGGVRNVAQYSVIVINKGERDELAVGDVLAIYRVGEKVRDRFTSELLQLPSERSGLMIVFRTFEKVSFGLVLKSTRRMTLLDEVKNP